MSRAVLIWTGLAVALIAPVVLAAFSPFLAWRGPVYIVAGFAGIIGLGLLLVQPLLISNSLPGVSPVQNRRMHRWIGGSVVFAVLVHVIGLWITSPPDVIDVLLFRSPTPFAIWGVLAMWAVFATALLALLRRPLRIRPSTWRMVHMVLALIIVIGTIIHAVQIEGAMETVSKWLLSLLVLLATLRVAADVGTRLLGRK